MWTYYGGIRRRVRFEIRSQQGAILKQSFKRVTIDGTVPTLDVSGVFNGIDWLPSDQIKAQLTDSGSGLLNVTYQVDNQSPIAWTRTVMAIVTPSALSPPLTPHRERQ